MKIAFLGDSVKGFDWKIHTVDGCHPNEEGHMWLAKQISDKLKTII